MLGMMQSPLAPMVGIYRPQKSLQCCLLKWVYKVQLGKCLNPQLDGMEMVVPVNLCKLLRN